MSQPPKKRVSSRFRAVPGFPGIEVSANGQVRSWWRWGAPYERLQKPRQLQPSVTSEGYCNVSVRHEDWAQARPVGVHRLVLMTFDRLPERHEVARHRKGLSNNIKNLRWGSQADNLVWDEVEMGKRPHPKTTVIVDRKKVKTTRDLSIAEAAVEIGCSVSSVYRIRKALDRERELKRRHKRR